MVSETEWKQVWLQENSAGELEGFGRGGVVDREDCKYNT